MLQPPPLARACYLRCHFGARKVKRVGEQGARVGSGASTADLAWQQTLVALAPGLGLVIVPANGLNLVNDGVGDEVGEGEHHDECEAHPCGDHDMLLDEAARRVRAVSPMHQVPGVRFGHVEDVAPAEDAHQPAARGVLAARVGHRAPLEARVRRAAVEVAGSKTTTVSQRHSGSLEAPF